MGTTGQVLTATNGTGTLGWSTGSGTSNVLLNMQVFTSGSGTYTPTAGTKSILVRMVGGGGAGGSTNYPTCSGVYFAGGGGGAGGYCEAVINSVAVSYSYTVGTGGTTVSTCGSAGNSGGTTTFGSYTANGGAGGIEAASGTVGAGGAGGTASGGTLNMTGAPGGPAQANWGYSGAGGGSAFGSGGAAWFDETLAHAGNAGVAYGSGGGGAVNYYSSNSILLGGTGAPGVIIVYEYK